MYVVTDLAMHTEDEETLVIYRDKQGKKWARPLSMFNNERFAHMGSNNGPLYMALFFIALASVLGAVLALA